MNSSSSALPDICVDHELPNDLAESHPKTHLPPIHVVETPSMPQMEKEEQDGEAIEQVQTLPSAVEDETAELAAHTARATLASRELASHRSRDHLLAEYQTVTPTAAAEAGGPQSLKSNEAAFSPVNFSDSAASAPTDSLVPHSESCESAQSAATRKRISYIGARSSSGKYAVPTEDGGSFMFETKGVADASQSYSTSLTRFLTSTGPSTPRIYPVAYAPGLDEDEHNEHNDKADGRRSSIPKNTGASMRGSAARHSVASNSRNEAKAATALATQTVQVSTAPMHGRQREVFVRTKSVIATIFDQPQESAWLKLVNRTMFVLIVLNFSIMALETCEGQNFPGSDPGYPYLPDEQTYKTLDAVISTIFIVELIGRVAAKKFSKAILTDPFTVADVIALVPWLSQVVLNLAHVHFSLDEMSSPAHSAALFRLLRAVRLGNVLRQHEQTRILYLSIRASLRPLGITMFFLFALVMLLATALFYAEPCYNVRTCQFTDIFNSAYFIMVTYVSPLVLLLLLFLLNNVLRALPASRRSGTAARCRR